MSNDFFDEGNWERVWKEGGELNVFGKIFQMNKNRKLRKILNILDVDKDDKILDVGCGTGRSLQFFKNLGFKKLTGIDISDSALELCNERGFKKGDDIYKMDGIDTGFDEDEFNLVHSGGLLEHFNDFEPFVKEWTRISKKYIMITQPNHFSIFSRVINAVRNHKVKEYTYKISDFEDKFQKYNFRLEKKSSFNFNEFWALVFENRG